MNKNNTNLKADSKAREMPHTDLYQGLLPVIFFVSWILDSNVFKLTMWLDVFLPLWSKIPLFILFLSSGIIFIYLSHNQLFKDHEAPEKLLTGGILGHVRNPLYLGILLIYVGLMFLSISIIAIILFIIIFLIYDKMANYEEKILDQLFGNEYFKYKEKVPKWIPKIKKANI